MKTLYTIFFMCYLFLVAYTLHSQNKEIYSLREKLAKSYTKELVTIAKCSVQAGKYDSLLTETSFKLNVCDGIIETHKDSVGIGE